MINSQQTLPNRYNEFTQAVVTDLDDTLFPKQEKYDRLTPFLPEKTKTYLSIEEDSFPADVALIGSTGRTAESTGKLAEQLGEETLNSIRPFDGLMVLNGATLYLNIDEDHESKPYPNADFFKQVGNHQLQPFLSYNTYLKETESSEKAELWSSTQLVNTVCKWLVAASHKGLSFEEIDKNSSVFTTFSTNFQQVRADAPDINRLLIATITPSKPTERVTLAVGSLPENEHQFAVVFFNDGQNDTDPKPMIIAVPHHNDKPTLYKTEEFSQVEQTVLTAFKKFTVGDTQTPAAYPHAEVALNKKRKHIDGKLNYGLATPSNRSYIEATPYNKQQAVEALLATLLPNVKKVVTAGDADNDVKALRPSKYLINEARTIPNRGVAIKHKNLSFLEDLGFTKESVEKDYSGSFPHIQLQVPETWAEGIQQALQNDN